MLSRRRAHWLFALMLTLPMAHGEEGEAWSYAWKSPDGTPNQLRLKINSKLAEKAFIGAGDLLDFDKIGALILANIRGLAGELSDESVIVTVTGDSLNALSYEAQPLGYFPGLAEARLDQMTAFVLDAMKDVEASTYYQYNPALRSLEVDYNEIASDYRSVVLDTLLALSQTLQTSDQIVLRDTLLDMLQSIEYTDLRRDDFPLLNPMRMLIEKRGDCESKQLFMAMAMKMLMPESKVELILLPAQEHIVMRYTGSNGSIILMDATGPSRTPAGQINPDYHLSGAIYYELIL